MSLHLSTVLCPCLPECHLAGLRLSHHLLCSPSCPFPQLGVTCRVYLTRAMLPKMLRNMNRPGNILIPSWKPDKRISPLINFIDNYFEVLYSNLLSLFRACLLIPLLFKLGITILNSIIRHFLPGHKKSIINPSHK